jgi:hypothetical protein
MLTLGNKFNNFDFFFNSLSEFPNHLSIQNNDVKVKNPLELPNFSLQSSTNKLLRISQTKKALDRGVFRLTSRGGGLKFFL